MVGQWISNLTPRRIIIYLVMIAVAIYVVWYVIEALEGFDAEYQPSKPALGSNTTTEIKGEIQVFDPSKKQAE
jgi:hypothetical protein